MKIRGLVLALAAVMMLMTACTKVPAGYVGIKVYLLGKEKGVNTEELGVGRYWIGINEELFLFPTFKQNYVWTINPTEGSENNESITFQTTEGLSVNADVGITYAIDPSKAHGLFKKYRRGIEEITDKFLRNVVRDAFNRLASTFKVESVYGKGKTELLRQVNAEVRSRVEEEGLIIEKIYLIGELRLPDVVVAALNSKIEAIQKAEKREYELRDAKASAKIKIENARAEAIAIQSKQRALTPLLIQYEAIQKWNGELPSTYAGGRMPFLNIK